MEPAPRRPSHPHHQRADHKARTTASARDGHRAPLPLSQLRRPGTGCIRRVQRGEPGEIEEREKEIRCGEFVWEVAEGVWVVR